MNIDIEKSSICSNSSGQQFKLEIYIKDHGDSEKYPEGVKAIFRLTKLNMDEVGKGVSELMILIDNHAPFGFHSHDKLPEDHDFRTPLHMSDWKEAWGIFQEKCREVLR